MYVCMYVYIYELSTVTLYVCMHEDVCMVKTRCESVSTLVRTYVLMYEI